VATAASTVTTKQYRHLVLALSIVRELRCRNLDEAITLARQALVEQKGGTRRFLVELLGPIAGEPARGWTIDYRCGRGDIHLEEQDRTLAEVMAPVVEQRYSRDGAWPAGVWKNGTYVSLG
jgi:hypothetical protein